MQVNCLDDFCASLGISEDCITKHDLAQLDRDGYLVLQPDANLARVEKLEEMRRVLDDLYEKEGARAGWEGLEFVIEREPGKLAEPGARRVNNLLNKHACFLPLIAMPQMIKAAQHVLKSEFRLSAVDMRDPFKGAGQQTMHIDWHPRMSDADPFDCIMCYFAVDDVRMDNGPLRVVPGSHKKLDYPQEHIDITKSHPNEIFVEAKAGSRIIINSLLWHSGVNNKSGDHRRVIFIEYRKRTLPQLLNQQRYLSDDVKKSLNEAQAWLLGAGPKYPVDESKQFGPGDAYRKRYPAKRSAHS